MPIDLNKYLFTPIEQRLLTVGVSQKQCEAWLADWRFFFILGIGRSGTAFLAELLNRAEGAYVFHEPVFEDFMAHAKAHYDQQAADDYMQAYRKKEIFVRMRHRTPGVYGEVTSTLRCHAAAIQKAFPGVTLIHLVRDGRAVVRSAMGRRTLTLGNPLSMTLHPTESDPWKTRWAAMDRFARICWLWQEENARLRKTIGRTVQLERILGSYDYFRDGVLDPCGIHVGEQQWERAIASPRNITTSYQMPKWEDWSSEQQRIYREICGDEMAKCGYVF